MLTLEQVGALQGSILCGGNNMHPAMRANRGSEPALPTLSALIKQGWKCCYSAAEKASGPDFALLLTLPGLRAPRSVSLPSCGTLPGLSQLAESPGQANACCLSVFQPRYSAWFDQRFGEALSGVVGRFSSYLFILGVNWVLGNTVSGGERGYSRTKCT